MDNPQSPPTPLGSEPASNPPGVPLPPPLPHPPEFPQPAAVALGRNHLDHSETSAVHIVWQWVSYGLWEWALISLSILLTATTAYYFIEKTGNYIFTVYVLAAMLCLLPLAFVADRMYRKFEPPQKHGFAAVVMVLNAVAVFLATIGGLITLVVSLLSLVVNADSSSNHTIIIISSFIVTVLGSLLFVRIINPPRAARFSKLFPRIVVGVAGLTLALTIAGPFRSQIITRDDRLIEDNLADVNSAIQSYTQSNKHLPPSLSNLNFDASYQNGAKTLMTRKLVSYRIISTNQPQSCKVLNSLYSQPDCSGSSATTMNYELCVTYKRAKGNPTADSSVTGSTYLTTSNHPAGQKCYPETATAY